MSKRITLRDKDGNIIGIQEVEEEGDIGYSSTNDSVKGAFVILCFVVMLFAYLVDRIECLFTSGCKVFPSQVKKTNDNCSKGPRYCPEAEEQKENISEPSNVVENNIPNAAAENSYSKHESTYTYFYSDRIVKEDGYEVEVVSYYKNVTKKGSVVNVTILANLKSEEKPVVNDAKQASSIYTNQYDCDLMKVRTLNVKMYDNLNGKGTEVSPPNFNNSWTPMSDRNKDIIVQSFCNL